MGSHTLSPRTDGCADRRSCIERSVLAQNLQIMSQSPRRDPFPLSVDPSHTFSGVVIISVAETAVEGVNSLDDPSVEEDVAMHNFEAILTTCPYGCVLHKSRQLHGRR